MSINGFIKNNVFYLSASPAYHVIELVKKQEEKLEFILIVFEKLEIIHKTN